MITRIFTISHDELVDAVLARAALCGDITGRGHILVDNDGAALRAVLSTLVPSALADNNIFCETVEGGWRLGPSGLEKSQVVAYLTALLLHRLTGKSSVPPEPLVTVVDDLPTLTPHYM